jgi:hypothetical protein
MLAIIASFIMHVGARHISFEITDAQKRLLSTPFSKAIILAALSYYKYSYYKMDCYITRIIFYCY